MMLGKRGCGRRVQAGDDSRILSLLQQTIIMPWRGDFIVAEGLKQLIRNILLIILIGVTIVWYEAPRLIKKQMWPELAAHLVFLVIGLALAIAMTLHLPVPNPTSAIETVFGPLSRLIYQ